MPTQSRPTAAAHSLREIPAMPVSVEVLGGSGKSQGEPGGPRGIASPSCDRLVLSAGVAFDVVQIRFLWLRGSLVESVEIAGAASLAFELVEWGTKRRSRREFRQALDAVGATLRVNCQRDYVSVTVTCLADRVEDALDLCVEMLTEPRDAAVDFDLVRAETGEAIAADLEMPESGAQRALVKSLWQDPAWAYPVDGWRDSRGRVGLEQLAAIRREVLSAPALIGIAADAPDRWRAAVLRSWDRLRSVYSLSGGADAVSATARPHGAVCVQLADSPQSALVVTGRGPMITDPGFDAAVVHAAYFGGGFHAPLMRRIRSQDGLSYDVSWGLRALTARTSVVVFSASPSVDNVAATLLGLSETWAQACDDDIDEEDLEIAKATLIGNTLISLETPRQRLNAAMGALRVALPITDLWMSPNRWLALTTQDVAAATASYGLSEHGGFCVVCGDVSGEKFPSAASGEAGLFGLDEAHLIQATELL